MNLVEVYGSKVEIPNCSPLDKMGNDDPQYHERATRSGGSPALSDFFSTCGPSASFFESTHSLDYSLDSKASLRRHPAQACPISPRTLGARIPSAQLPPLSPPPNPRARLPPLPCSPNPSARLPPLSPPKGACRRRGSASPHASPNRSPMRRSPRPPLMKNAPRKGILVRHGCFFSGHSSSRSPKRSQSPRVLSPRGKCRRGVTFDLPDESSVAHSYGTEESLQFCDMEDEFDLDHESDHDRYFMPEDENEKKIIFRGALPFSESIDSETEVSNHLLEYARYREACLAPDAESYTGSTLEGDEVHQMGKSSGDGSIDDNSISSLHDEDPLLGKGNPCTMRVQAIERPEPLENPTFDQKLDLCSLQYALPVAPLTPYFKEDATISVSSETSSESPTGVLDFPKAGDGMDFEKGRDQGLLVPKILPESLQSRGSPHEGCGKEIKEVITKSTSGKLRTTARH